MLKKVRQFFGGDGDRRPPSNELEIHDRVSEPTATHDPFLADNNMGLGVLTEPERYQQLQGFYDGLYGQAALGRAIEDSAIRQAKEGLLQHTDEEPPSDDELRDDDSEYVSVREWRADKREEVWANADEESRIRAIAEYAGVTEDWIPSHWRMNIARTEFSRSQDGRLLGDTMGRTREIKTDVPEEMQGLGGETA